MIFLWNLSFQSQKEELIYLIEQRIQQILKAQSKDLKFKKLLKYNKTSFGLYQQLSISNKNLNSMQNRSVYGLSNSFVSTLFSVSGYEVKLPAISQPLLSRYRSERLKIDLLSKGNWNNNFIMELFCGKENDSTISMCTKCEHSKEGNFCRFIVQMIQQRYDWRNDLKFISTYEFYNKKKIAIFLTDQQIQYRLISKFNILGVVLLDNHKLLLMRILKNYLKHTIYYGQEKRLSLQNDYYFWFLIGIYYHVGVPKYFNDLQILPKDTLGINETMMFWLLDAVMKKLNDCTQSNIRNISQKTLEYCKFFYPKECKSLALYEINLNEIFYEWMNEAMMGYMGIQFIGFYIKSILKQGFEYIQKTIMSYFEKRTLKLDKDQIISFHHEHYEYLTGKDALEENRRSKKQQILKILLDSQQQWPGIFFSTNVYDLKD